MLCIESERDTNSREGETLGEGGGGVDFLYLFYPFLTVQNAPSKTMLEYRCKKEMLIPR